MDKVEKEEERGETPNRIVQVFAVIVITILVAGLFAGIDLPGF